MKLRLLFLSIVCSFNGLFAQVDDSKTGAWFMYFYNHQFKNSQWGIQGDLQYRDWQGVGDLEQLMLRSGLTFTPKDSGVMFTLGYANITSGQFGDSDNTSGENRIYQEALIPQKLGSRFYVTHRFRYEQRFVENQDFRTRYRYNIFLNVPLNKKELAPKAIYAALYNELFINGETAIGDERSVELFDRNRTYLGLGYVLNPTIRFQLGWMNQKTDNWSKGQWQISMHHNF
ncbi:DUF2490 domain-containing protein [uncultured Winogradskyella sp.]|uniref:DUF2490 domain-containing protein n=1 Tax=uncultured Winogradskyella sp. TaxID=395353 RepID=UPI0030DB956C|tara:strand:+ start:75472 stop:76161 length:690 start_codon:yes stop_codon:yes gene_type:complete